MTFEKDFQDKFPSFEGRFCGRTDCKELSCFCMMQEIYEKTLDKQKVRDSFKRCIKQIRESLGIEKSGAGAGHQRADELALLYQIIFKIPFYEAKKELGLII